MIVELPRVTQAQLLIAEPLPDVLIELAERGLFVFDWQDVHRPIVKCSNRYEAVALPAVPISTDGLPPLLKTVAVEATLRAATFRTERMLDVCAQIPCRKP
jgi:hypothetical protein